MSVARDDVQRALVVLDAHRPVEIRQFRPDLADDEAFLRWANQPLLEGFQIESDAHGVVSIMSPTGWSSGPINARFIRLLDTWAEVHGVYVTESSASRLRCWTCSAVVLATTGDPSSAVSAKRSASFKIATQSS